MFEPFSIVESPEFLNQVIYYFGANRLSVWDAMRRELDLVIARAGMNLRGSITVLPGLKLRLEADSATHQVTYKELI